MPKNLRQPLLGKDGSEKRRAGRIGILLVALLMLGGCGYSQGQALYFLGFGRRAMVEAKFRLTDQPILILVDDAAGHVDWPMATGYLIDNLSQELLKRKGANRIIPRRTLNNLRRADPRFEKRSARKIGELAGATQVLWIEVRDYLGEAEFLEVANAAYFSVMVKVLNVLEKESRSKVRLWPASREGHYVTVSLTGGEVAIAKTKDTVSKELASRLAVAIAKLFCDYRPDDLEQVK